MFEPTSCPRCGNDFKGPEVPEEHREAFGATHFSTVVGVEIRGVYDGIAYWQDPVCGWAFHRFGSDHPRYEVIDLFVQQVRDLFPEEAASTP